MGAMRGKVFRLLDCISLAARLSAFFFSRFPPCFFTRSDIKMLGSKILALLSTLPFLAHGAAIIEERQQTATLATVPIATQGIPSEAAGATSAQIRTSATARPQTSSTAVTSTSGAAASTSAPYSSIPYANYSGNAAVPSFEFLYVSLA